MRTTAEADWTAEEGSWGLWGHLYSAYCNSFWRQELKQLAEDCKAKDGCAIFTILVMCIILSLFLSVGWWELMMMCVQLVFKHYGCICQIILGIFPVTFNCFFGVEQDARLVPSWYSHLAYEQHQLEVAQGDIRELGRGSERAKRRICFEQHVRYIHQCLENAETRLDLGRLRESITFAKSTWNPCRKHWNPFRSVIHSDSCWQADHTSGLQNKDENLSDRTRW